MADAHAAAGSPLIPVVPETVRDPLADPAAVRAARLRPMAERLELALNWNRVASELQVGLAAVRVPDPPQP